MQKRLAVISIIVEDTESATEVNAILHSCGEYIVGRMGIPCRDRGVSVICVVIDADENTISSLSGKLGMVKNVSSKVTMAKKL